MGEGWFVACATNTPTVANVSHPRADRLNAELRKMFRRTALDNTADTRGMQPLQQGE